MLLFLVACGGPEGTKVDSGEAEAISEEPVKAAAVNYTVDVAQSNIVWKGTKLVGGGHEGTLKLTEGDLILTDGKIVAGKFTIDMASLTNTDLEGEGKGKLEGHLKSDDFFDVANHPTASFEVASIQAVEGTEGVTHEITGNLTMKGTARSITIPASVQITDGSIMATTPDFVINRTEWGVQYGSGTAFTDLAKDNIINDNVGLQLTLVAKK